MELHLPPAADRLPRHRARLEAACRVGMDDPAVVGMTIGGSFAEGEPDDVSDLDLRVVVEDEQVEATVASIRGFAAAAGPLLAAFTGEHVGEPNLLICLYEDLVHVDYLTVGLSALPEQNHGRASLVLWERGGRVSAELPGDPGPDDTVERLQWFEDRMWTWCWYVQSKILRGELYEAIDGLNYIRGVVLFRLVAETAGAPYTGARRVESLLGDRVSRFEATGAGPDAGALLAGLRATMDLYRELADPLLAQRGIPPATEARRAVLDALSAGLAWTPEP